MKHKNNTYIDIIKKIKNIIKNTINLEKTNVKRKIMNTDNYIKTNIENINVDIVLLIKTLLNKYIKNITLTIKMKLYKNNVLEDFNKNNDHSINLLFFTINKYLLQKNKLKKNNVNIGKLIKTISMNIVVNNINLIETLLEK